MRVYACDCLIIGSGGAALRAAIAACEELLLPPVARGRVILATKGRLGESGVTAKACSDRMAFHVTLEHTEPGGPDNWRYHADDVFRIGGHVSDEDLAVILARNSRDAFDYLDSLGVPFVRRPDGKVDQFVTDGSAYARAAYVGPHTAVEIEKALVRKVRSLPPGILAILENHAVVSLLLDESGKRVAGALALDGEEAPVEIRAKATVMATGGAGGVFAVNVFPPENTGEGYAMAYDVGAELVNMEFIQIGIASLATGLACSGSIPRSVPRFVNDRGDEFLPRYAPDLSLDELYNVVFEKGAAWPLQSEHLGSRIDIAIQKEINSGRRAFLDFGANPVGFDWNHLAERCKARYDAEVKQSLGLGHAADPVLRPAPGPASAPGSGARYESPLKRLLEINPDSVRWFKERGIDLAKGDTVEIAPAVQHFQGGIKIRGRANATVGALFAAGECAGGQHGANRPGGHALLDCQVFGEIAGREAALEARVATTSTASTTAAAAPARASLARALARIEAVRGGSGLPSREARSHLRKMLSRCAGVVRTAEGLELGLKDLAELEAQGVTADEAGLLHALETSWMFRVAEIVMSAARTRTESRGPHLFFSSDEDMVPLPRDDEKWKEYIVVRKGPADAVSVERRRPVTLACRE